MNKYSLLLSITSTCDGHLQLLRCKYYVGFIDFTWSRVKHLTSVSPIYTEIIFIPQYILFE